MAEPDELVVPESVSAQMLNAHFTEANMDSSIDRDGDVQIVEGYRCFIDPGHENRWLRVFAVFRVSADAPLEARLEDVNRVNAELVIVRADVDSTGRFTFDHYISDRGRHHQASDRPHRPAVRAAARRRRPQE